MDEDDGTVAWPSAFPLQTDITPGEFEEFVAARLLGSAASEVDDLAVALHEKVTGADGTYDVDATVRYTFAGMAFLVIVEAKLHKNPIKRELVQVLHQKVRSVGAHKGVMVSTAPYQSGAVVFAKAHGIALVTVTEDRFLFETRDEPSLSSGLMAHYYNEGPGAVRVSLLSPDDDEYPRQAAEFLLGRPAG